MAFNMLSISKVCMVVKNMNIGMLPFNDILVNLGPARFSVFFNQEF